MDWNSIFLKLAQEMGILDDDGMPESEVTQKKDHLCENDNDIAVVDSTTRMECDMVPEGTKTGIDDDATKGDDEEVETTEVNCNEDSENSEGSCFSLSTVNKREFRSGSARNRTAYSLVSDIFSNDIERRDILVRYVHTATEMHRKATGRRRSWFEEVRVTNGFWFCFNEQLFH